MLDRKRSTQKENGGVSIIQVSIDWVGSVSSIDVILDDLDTFSGRGLHDLHELHTHVNLTYMCRDSLMHSFAWVGPHDLKDLYDLQGLHNVDVSLFFWR